MKTQTIKTCAATLFLAGITTVHAEQKNPNIIFIMANDLGYGDVSCNNPESKIYTPHIDSLAANGIRFTDAHSGAALSTPTRYGVLTGRYSFRSRLKSGVLGAEAEPLIETNTLTAGQLLQQNGYNTACFGKWHLGINYPKKGNQTDYSGTFENGPITRGFDYYYGVNTNSTGFFIENDKVVEAPTAQRPEGMWGYPGTMAPGWTFENVMPTLKDKAIDYIKNNSGKRDTDKPFFMYFATTTPHTPIVPLEHFIGTSQAHRIGDFIQQFDWEVGEILKALKEEGLDENTLVIFTSDNGPMHWDGSNMQGGTNSIFKHGHNPSYIFRGKKSDAWEAGHRVPYIAYWPAQIPAGIVSDEIISLIDLTATCADIIGVKLPEGAAQDSYSILPALKNENTTPVRNELVNYSGGGGYVLRQGNWKFIEAGGSRGFTAPQSDADAAALGLPPVQLYNLAEDPAEEHNLQALYPEKIKELTMLLDSIRYGKVTFTSVEDFEIIRNNLNGNFYLGADIVIPDGTEWIPIGARNETDNNPVSFKGTFDGCGYSIKNLNITTENNFKGLFGRLEHATVKNLELEVNISGGNIAGGVAGAVFAESTIERVSVSGSVQGNDEVGGIAGRISFDPNYKEYNTIRDCYVEADVKATGNNAGGIVGYTRKNGTINFGKIEISNVYTTGKVSSSSDASAVSGNAAGILAYTEHNYVKLDNSAVLCAEITGTTPNYFYSRDVIPSQLEKAENLYAWESINLVYQDESDKGAGAEIDVTGKLLALPVFTTRDFYENTLGWNFEYIWHMNEGEHPWLKMIDPPAVIDTAVAIGNYEVLNTKVRNNMSGEFYLTNDIDIPDGTEWLPFGMPEDFSTNQGNLITVFTGTFDGRGYSIKGLKMKTGKHFSGLFGRLSENAVIKNLGLENVDITGGVPTGALAGTMFKQGSSNKGVAIENVFVTGTIAGGSEVGGLVGRVNNSPENTITNCYVHATVEALRENNAYAGGMVGCMNTGNNLTVKNSYFAGCVKSVHYAGGILGYINNNNAITKFTLEASAVVAGEIDAPNKAIFYNRGAHSGSPGNLTKTYARNDIEGLSNSTEGILESPDVFLTKDFYEKMLGWDFENIWYMREGQYPTLREDLDTWLDNNIFQGTGFQIYSTKEGITLNPFGQRLAAKIYTLSGQLVYQSEINSIYSIALSKGVYLVNISSVMQSETYVIIVH